MDFLNDKEWWEIVLMVLLSAFGIGGLLLILITSIKKNGINLVFGKTKVTTAQEETDTKIEVDPLPASNGSHRNCPRWREILVVVQIESEKVTKINHIREIETIRDQMNYAEEKIGELRKIMRSRFLKLMKDMTGEDSVIHLHPTCDYGNVLRILCYEILNKFRTVFRENHLPEMSDNDFESYLKDRVMSIKNMITEILDEVYPQYTEPTREMVYDANMDIMSKMNEIIEDTIRRGRIMAKAKEDQIRILEQQARDEVQKILNGE